MCSRRTDALHDRSSENVKELRLKRAEIDNSFQQSVFAICHEEAAVF